MRAADGAPRPGAVPGAGGGAGDTSQHAYDYAIVRVVPRVERGEFVNAGAIVSCQRAGFLQAAVALDEARLLALDPHADLATVQRHLRALVAICAGAPEGGPIARLPFRARFHWLTARRSSVIQTSPVHTGLCADPHGALAHVIRRMVLPLPATGARQP